MSKKNVLLSMYITIFWAAFGYIMYSALISSFVEKYQLTLTEAGIIGSVLCVGQLLVQFLCSPLSKRFAKLHLVLMGAAISMVSFVLIAITNSYPVVLFAFLLDGASISLLNVVICAYISDEFSEKRSSYLNLFHGIYGLGSMIGPVLPTILLAKKAGWEKGYWLVCIVGIFIFIRLVFTAKSGRCGSKTGREEASFIRLMKTPRLLLICFCTMLCVGFDVAISTYMASYFEKGLHAASVAGLAITLYWGGSAAGRLLYPILFARFKPKRFLVVINFLTGGLLILGGAIGSLLFMFIVICLTGLFSGMNYPMEIGFACEVFPENSIAAANATCFSASVGGIITPLIAGKLIEVGGFPLLIILCAAMLGCISLLLILFMRMEKRMHIRKAEKYKKEGVRSV